MDDFEEEEDVIIEGSELHRALVSMGYTDFESTNKNNFSKEPSSSKYTRFEIYNFFKMWNPLRCIFDHSPKACYPSSKQFATILRLESLLDDHAAIVQTFVEKHPQSFWQKCTECYSLVISSAMLGIGYLMYERKKTLIMFLATSIAAFSGCHKYEEFQAVRALRNLVGVQNELYHLYKKSLGVLRNVYKLRIDEKKIQTKFSKLEVDRLKYLSPLTETLLRSMENVSRTHYQASSMIVRLLPKNALQNVTLTHFENDEFAIEGEITYEKVRHLYYVYVLVQSDTMQLLAIAYNPDTWTDNERISHSLLTRIIVHLGRLLTNDKNQLVQIIREYESCKRRTIERKFRVRSATKWRDLYLNLDLLSRKLQTTYDEIVSILDEMDKRQDDETTETTFIADLAARTQMIYGQIDKSRNFAEFNNLLLAILQRSRGAARNPISEIDDSVTEVEDDRTILRDSEPQIIDEVFEEYITEEYLKPLYEENDEATIESAKLDKLLAKNFMSELKEVLVDKYKSMSEREAIALTRKYRRTSECPNFEENIVNKVASKMNFEEQIIPCPPPLPGPVTMAKESRKKKGSRGPVPLPRSRKFEDISSQRVAPPIQVSLPPPPPPLPSSKIEESDNNERFSFDLPKLCARKIPSFVTCAEEFIGSGENSEEESENRDKDDD